MNTVLKTCLLTFGKRKKRHWEACVFIASRTEGAEALLKSKKKLAGTFILLCFSLGPVFSMYLNHFWAHTLPE